MKILLLSTILGFLILTARVSLGSSAYQDTLYKADDIILQLSNPGVFSGQLFVDGNFYLLDNQISFRAYSENELVHKSKKFSRNNFLIEDIDIAYGEITEMKKRFLLWVPRLIVITKNGRKYDFLLRIKDRRKIVALINSKKRT